MGTFYNLKRNREGRAILMLDSADIVIEDKIVAMVKLVAKKELLYLNFFDNQEQRWIVNHHESGGVVFKSYGRIAAVELKDILDL